MHQFRVHDEATMAKQQAVKDDENKFLETTRESAEQLLHLFETDTGQPEDAGSAAYRRAPSLVCGPAMHRLQVLVGIQQHRRIEALEARQHAPVGVVHDALRVLVGARAEQHADHHIILRPRQILAQQLVSEARQPLVHFVGELVAHRVAAVAVADLGLLGDLANQARNEPGLVDQAKSAKNSISD